MRSAFPLLGSLAAACFRQFGPKVAGTLNETQGQPGLSAETTIQAKQAFLMGFHVAVGIGGAVTLVVGILALFWLPRKLPA